MTAVFVHDTPFTAARPFQALPGGLSISALLDLVKAPAAVHVYGQVDVCGVPVPRGWWSNVKVKADAWVTVRVVPRGGGGGGGGKQIIGTLATIALLVGATAITAGAFGPAGLGIAGGLFASGSLSAYALAAGVSVVGQLALSALAPPPVSPSLSGGGAPAAREIAGVTGNPLSRRDYLPWVAGTMRASPPHLMFPYTELVDGEVVANAMVGLAGQYVVEDIQLAGAPIGDFDGVDYQVSTDGSLISLFDYGSAVEQPVNEALSEWQLQTETGKTDWTLDQTDPSKSYPNWKTFKTRGAADRVDIRLFWPSGILSQNANAGAQMMAMQFRLAGSGTWINGPEFWWSDRFAKQTQKRQHIRLNWQAAPAGIGATNDDTWAWVAYGATPQAWQWKPDSYFAPASGLYAANVNVTDDGFEIFLDPAVFPKGQYEVRLKRGLQIGRVHWSKVTYVFASDASRTRWYDSMTASSPFRAANNMDDQTGPCIIETFLSHSDEYPVNQGNLTVIAVRARGVRIDQVSALFTCIVPARDAYFWNFKRGLEGWDVSQASGASQAGSSLVWDPGAADEKIYSPVMNIDGGVFNTVRFRIKEVVPSTTFQGVLRYSTPAHSFSMAYRQVIDESLLVTGEWVEFELDMTSLDAGGTDWTDSIITQLRLDLDDDGTGSYEIDWIAVSVAEGDDWQPAPTRNPASLYRYVLTSDLNARKVKPYGINDAVLQEWHGHCATEGYECNAAIQGGTGIMQQLQIIAAAGWALPQRSATWGVVIEKDMSGESPQQLFTQRDTRNLVIEKTFAGLPHAIVGTFLDETDDYREAEEIHYLPGWTPLTATEFQTIPYDGLTATAAVRARLKLDAGQLLYRQQRYTFEADIAHLGVGRGALVALSYDTLGSMYDAARIIEVLDDGAGNITGFRLDAVVNIEPSPASFFAISDFFAVTDFFGETAASGVTVQRIDGSTVTLPIEEIAATDVVTLTTPVIGAGAFVPGLTAAVGRMHREVRRCKVFSIERVADNHARMTLIDEAPQLHA